MTDTPMYGGAINANHVGGFVKNGLQFEIVRPGYDCQGRRRQQWTQVIHKGVPVFTVKLIRPISDVIDRFDALWEENIGDDAEILEKVLRSNHAAHMARFRDGVTGETPAPTHTRDGPMQTKVMKST